MRAALKSLPWYLVGSYLLTPLICLPFTVGASLVWYFFPFAQLFNPHISLTEVSTMTALVTAPGFLLWLIKRFFGAAVEQWKRNHLVRY